MGRVMGGVMGGVISNHDSRLNRAGDIMILAEGSD